MAYRVELSDEVEAQARAFNAPNRYYWNRARTEIAADPFCRSSSIWERESAIVPWPLIPLEFQITCRQYVSGEWVYVFGARFLLGRQIVYTVYEQDGEVEIFAFRN